MKKCKGIPSVTLTIYNGAMSDEDRKNVATWLRQRANEFQKWGYIKTKAIRYQLMGPVVPWVDLKKPKRPHWTKRALIEYPDVPP